MAGILKNDLKKDNELLQFIGMGVGIEPHPIKIPDSYETIILTSDGVHFIDNNVIQRVMQTTNDSVNVVRRLTEIAKYFGGPDNASIIAAKPVSLNLQTLDDIGIIQIWDPFGDLQIIEADSEIIAKKDNKQQFGMNQLHIKETQKALKEEKLNKKRKTSKHKDIVKVSSKKKDPPTKKERPQIKIYFNDNTGKDNND